ncbi:LytTR family transcriptional regulator [Phocaeicola coprophilus]|uniref:LytTR family transcriptional regulator n=1 Tax=Phocaeicola coprophilus TaxID=387090 RepID=A0A413SY10_9BACT|nr:LytTR family transcriptional regulator [Phocaeicola coprophilus]
MCNWIFLQKKSVALSPRSGFLLYFCLLLFPKGFVPSGSVEVPSASPVFTEESITLKVGYKSTNVKLKDILYIESMDNYVRIYLPERQCIMSQTSMKNIQELLPEGKFTRVHKSFLVPVHRIASHTSKEITLYGGIRLPVGRSYSKELKLILPEV